MRKIFYFLVNLLFPPRHIEEFFQNKNNHKLVPRPERNLRNWIISVFSYKDKNVRDAIRVMKNHQSHILSKIFGELMYKKVQSKLSRGNYIVIPIPVSKQRRSERGFNQAELLATEFCKHDARLIYRNNILSKITETQKQALIKDKQKRLQNVIGCFAMQEDDLQQCPIILIDDITTTGATLSEARKVLLKAQADEVIAVTIGH